MAPPAADNAAASPSAAAAQEASWRALFGSAAALAGVAALDQPAFVAVAFVALATRDGGAHGLGDASDLEAAFALADVDCSGRVDEGEFVALMVLVEAGLVAGLGGSAFNPFKWGKEDKFKAAAKSAPKGQRNKK
jgi:hypothetical protein